MSRTILTNYPDGYTLTNSGDNPVYVGSGVIIASPAGIGLQSNLAVYWALTNEANANISGYTFGVSLASAASVINDGTITAAQVGGNSYTYTPATLGILSAAVYAAGGGVSNSQGGFIVGGLGGLGLGAAGSVVNAGEIESTVAGYGFGVALAKGGNVTNLTGGLISSGRFGILGVGTATVSNSAGASITGGQRGILIVAGAASVTNLGRITGTALAGVDLFDGGMISNASGASIVGADLAIGFGGAAGTVINQGNLVGSSAYGVYLAAGGGVTNQTGGTISGGYGGLLVKYEPGSVINQGLIEGLATFSSQTDVMGGVVLVDGGSVVNQPGGTITAGRYGVWITDTAGTVTNAGSIFSSASGTASGSGVVLVEGGSLYNSGGIAADHYAVRVQNAAGTVTNMGSISSSSAGGAGVVLQGGGSLDNGGGIAAYFDGVLVANAAGTVTNTGSISISGAGGAGVVLLAGGAVDSGDLIVSAGYGVELANAAGTVINTGTIESTSPGGGARHAGVGLLAGGAVTNGVGAFITGEYVGLQFGTFPFSGAGLTTVSTLVNQGTISASNVAGAGAAVWIDGPGVVTNQAGGMIEGGTNGTIAGGPLNGYGSGPYAIVAYYQTTVINYGSIGGTKYAFDASNSVVSIGNRIEMAPGATFGGVVLGAHNLASAPLSTLELMSGASAGTVSGFGSHYKYFGNVSIDSGARWSLAGTVSAGTSIAFAANGTGVLTFADPSEMQGTIDDFAPGDTIGLDGIAVTASSYVGGVLTLTDASGTIAINLPGTFSAGELMVTNDPGTAEVVIQPPRTLSWTGANGTAFGTAANWDDITGNLNPALAAPNQTDTIEFNNFLGAISGTATVSALYVGSTGAGVLQITGGDTLVAGSFDAGVAGTAVAQIGLTGPGTSLSITGAATVADAGTGVLSVLSGATFSAASLTIGANKGSSGAVIVSGAGSDLVLSGVLNIGSALGAGDLTVGPSAAVHASVINLDGQAVLEGGLLDPSVTVINPNKSLGGSGTVASGDIIDEGILQAGDGTPGQLELVQGTIVGGGTLTENGSKVANKANAVGVLQINTFGTMEVDGAVLNAATTTFANDVTPTTTYTVTHSVIDVNFEDSTGVLQLDDIAGFGGTIAAFQAGDQFIITGGKLSGLGVNNGATLTMADSGNGGTDQIIFSSPVSASYFNIVNGNTVDVVSCFATGTRIGTADGPVAVETLRVGDHVVTGDGRREPVVWIGQRAVDCSRHPDPGSVCPVRILAGAFGPGLPSCDLWLSPDHAVFVDGVLIPVHCLINGGTIRQMVVPEVTYYHVELPEHAVILAEQLPVESYLDTGNRANFSNAGGNVRLFPNFSARMWEMAGCAPLVMTGPVLEQVRRSLAALPLVSPPRAPWSRLNNRYTYY